QVNPTVRTVSTTQVREPPRDTLRAIRVIGDSSQFGIISSLLVLGDRILVADVFTDPHISLIRLRDGRVLNRLGRNGAGPGEFRQPIWLDAAAGLPGLVWAYDGPLRRLTLIDPNAPWHEATRKTVQLRTGTSPKHFVWLKGEWRANGLFPDYLFLHFDTAGQQGAKVRGTPPFTSDVPDTGRRRFQLNDNVLAGDPGSGRWAVAFTYVSRIDVWSGERQDVTIRGPRPVAMDGRDHHGTSTKDYQFAYTALAASSRHLYAAFSGASSNESGFATRLHVFRWNGDFLGEVALDTPVTALAVSANRQELYVAGMEPFPTIRVYTLPARLR
ncbi:MAG: hypothetical protein ACRENB_15715, partial [Gemmatimonadales bacterium]